MATQIARKLVAVLAPMAAVGALLVSADADAAAIPGLNSKAAVRSDDACILNLWSGVQNNCLRYVRVQAAAQITTAGEYLPEAWTYGDETSTLQTWGVNTSLDWIWTTGLRKHNADNDGNPRWSGFLDAKKTYVPANGGLLWQVTLAPGDRVQRYYY